MPLSINPPGVLLGVLLITATIGVQASIPRQARAQDDDLAEFRRLQETYRQKSLELQFTLADESSTKLEVMPKPVMTWTSLGGWSGDVFVWTGKGRIQIVGCIGSHKLDDGSFQIFQEFHALLDEPLQEARLDDSQAWTPLGTVRLETMKDVPKPSESKSLRLVQMRRLARSFSFGMRVDEENFEKELRLLPQPVARESGGSGPVKDSALFTFVSSSGTDPEVFLLLEAREVDQSLVWTYSVARFTTREIWQSRGGIDAVVRIDATEDWDWTQPRIEQRYFYRNESILSATELAEDR